MADNINSVQNTATALVFASLQIIETSPISKHVCLMEFTNERTKLVIVHVLVIDY